MRLRPYREEDAAVIAGWIKNETALRQWSADRYGAYPVSPEDINRQYAGFAISDTLFPVTAVEGTNVVGHILLRFPGEDRSVMRFGFVIVDDQKRGMGWGKKLLTLAMTYARETFGVKKITLGVFENQSICLSLLQVSGLSGCTHGEGRILSCDGSGLEVPGNGMGRSIKPNKRAIRSSEWLFCIICQSGGCILPGHLPQRYWRPHLW